MFAIAEDYQRTYGNRELAAYAFCRDLMQGDPATFKVGYTRENAILATIEAFNLDAIEQSYLRESKLDWS